MTRGHDSAYEGPGGYLVITRWAGSFSNPSASRAGERHVGRWREAW